MTIVVLVLGLVLVPPLSSEHLDGIVDGTGDLGTPFEAFVEHVSTWQPPATIQLDTLPLRRTVAWADVAASPAELRGELVLLSGSLLQRTSLPRSFNGVTLEEWFVLKDGVTVVAYVLSPESAPTSRAAVRVLGRIYGTISATTRGGERRTWPSIVGISLPLAERSTGSVVFIGVVVAGVALFFLIRRHVSSRHSNVEAVLASLAEDADEEGAEPRSLPSDPAAALEALHENHHEDT